MTSQIGKKNELATSTFVNEMPGESRAQEFEQEDNLTAGKIGMRIRREGEQKTVACGAFRRPPEPDRGVEGPASGRSSRRVRGQHRRRSDAAFTFDIGIIPDPINEFNDKLSMKKIFEYSALGIPRVAYELAETHRLLGTIAQFADDAKPAGPACACLTLIKDDQARAECGRAAKALADERFDWAREWRKYVASYRRLSRAK